MDQFASVSNTLFFETKRPIVGGHNYKHCLKFDFVISASDYDASIRPGPSSGFDINCIPTVLELLQVLKHLWGLTLLLCCFKVSEKDFSLTGTFYVSCYWEDERIQWKEGYKLKSPHYALQKSLASKLWAPRMRVGRYSLKMAPFIWTFFLSDSACEKHQE